MISVLESVCWTGRSYQTKGLSFSGPDVPTPTPFPLQSFIMHHHLFRVFPTNANSRQQQHNSLRYHHHDGPNAKIRVATLRFFFAERPSAEPRPAPGIGSVSMSNHENMR